MDGFRFILYENIDYDTAEVTDTTSTPVAGFTLLTDAVTFVGALRTGGVQSSLTLFDNETSEVINLDTV